MTTTPDAGEQLGALLSDDLNIDAGPDAAPEAQAASQDAPGDETAPPAPAHLQADDDGPDDQADGDETDEADEAAGQDDDGDEPEDEAPAPGETFTVKIDGEEHEVSRDEVIAGYQRQADYSRKTQALAEDRRHLEAERGQYVHLLGALEQRLSELQPQTQAEADAIYQQRAAIAAEQQRLESVEQHRELEARSGRIEDARRQLLTWEPRWQDDTVRMSDFNETLKYARTLGYTDAELAAADDPRALIAVYKASLYDKLRSEADNVRQHAVKKGQKVLKAGGAEGSLSTAQRSARTDRARLRQSGSLSDAAAVLSTLIE